MSIRTAPGGVVRRRRRVRVWLRRGADEVASETVIEVAVRVVISAVGHLLGAITNLV